MTTAPYNSQCDHYDRLIDALRDDLKELSTCALLCSFHIALAVVIMRYVLSALIGHQISWDAACSTGVLLGGVKLLQVSDGRSYLGRTHDHWRAHHRMPHALHPVVLAVLFVIVILSIGGHYV